MPSGVFLEKALLTSSPALQAQITAEPFTCDSVRLGLGSVPHPSGAAIEKGAGNLSTFHWRRFSPSRTEQLHPLLSPLRIKYLLDF